MYEEVRRAMDDVLVSEDDVELVRRGGRDESDPLLAAAHRHVALIGRRRLAEHGVQTTRRVRRSGGRRPCCRLQRSRKMAATTKAEVVERDADRLAGTDDERPRRLGASAAGDVTDDAGQVPAGRGQTPRADIWRRLTGTRRRRRLHCIEYNGDSTDILSQELIRRRHSELLRSTPQKLSEFAEITQNNGQYAVQGHSRSPISIYQSKAHIRFPISDYLLY